MTTHEKTGLTIGQTFIHPKFGKGEIVDFPSMGYYAMVRFDDSYKLVYGFNSNDKLFDPVNLKLIINRSIERANK